MALDKTFNAAEAEARLYAAWEKAGAFAAGANASRPETFSIMIPPPNVTGVLHMGHAFNNTLQDILTRWHRMRGFDTLWQPGQDHAGIATQMVVERELAKDKNNATRREMGREAFTDKIWEWKKQSGGTIIEQLKRLGASCDWSRNAFTMSGAPGAPAGEEGNFHDAVIKVFVKMYNDGLIYRGKRLVNWDPHFETAISDLEVESTEVDGHMWHFKYPLAGGATYTYVEKDEDGNVTLEEVRDYISIATTRPETMLGDGAVAVHPSDARYASIIGKLCEIPVGPKEHRRLIPIITDEYPDPDFGSGAVKITGAHDFNDYGVAQRNNIPLYALMDTRGAMRADGLPYEQAAARAQAIAEGVEAAPTDATEINLVPEDYRGLDRFDARDKIVREIIEEGLVVTASEETPNISPLSISIEGRRKRQELVVLTGPNKEFYVTETADKAIASASAKYPDKEVRLASEAEEYVEDDEFYNPDNKRNIVWLRKAHPLIEAKKIMQPFGDRSKVVIEPMLTDQWFVATDKIVGPAIDAVRNGDVTILPEQDKKVYFHWLENIEPWCISRQLWWGHQIPVWFDDEGNEFCAATENGAVMAAVQSFEDRGAFPEDISGIENKLAFVKRNLTRDPDVLDTWFSSGLWPIGTLGWPEQTEALQKYFPTSVLITGFDIIFFWVARMMMMQYAVVDQKPFDTVYVHALVRDEKGKKMSKSLGNVLDPLELIDEYGADAVRFTVTSMAAMGRDLKLSTARIAGYRNFGTKLWNAHRFAEMNDVFTENTRMHALCTSGVQSVTINASLNKWIIGETARVRQDVDNALENYRFNDAANTLYAFVWGKVCDWYVELSKPLLQEGSTDAEETRATLGWVLDQCLILLHPIMPFITEELWQATGNRDKMLVHADWPTYTTKELLDDAADRELNWVVGLIESIRSARAQMHVPAGLKVPMIVTEMDPAAKAAWDGNETMIKRLARVESLEKADTFPKGTVSIPAPGATFGLPLAGLIDIDEEKARLQKSLGKLGKEIGGLKGRLNNPKFAASAPEEVVAEAQSNLNARQEEADQLQAALSRLAEME